MRVLWFTNTPSSYAEKFLDTHVIAGGWLSSLENELAKSEKIQELGVAFLQGRGREIKTARDGKVTYYMIQSSRNRIGRRLANQFKPFSVNEQNLSNYLSVIRDFGPNVIEIWGTELDYGLVAPRVNVPVTVHLQGIITPCSHKYFASGLSYFESLRYAGAANAFKRTGPFWEVRDFRRGARREQAALRELRYVIGRTFWDRYIARVLAPRARYFHNDEMLRDPFYRARWDYQARDRKVLLTTSQGNVYKGFETVLACAEMLKGRLDFEWRIVGVDRTELNVRVLERLAKVKMEDLPVVFLGRKNAEELVDEMKAADLFVHPSHIENSPNSVCEAMMLGMPVIATYAGGTGSLLETEKEGLLIQDGDPWALSGAILRLLEDSETAVLFGQEARKKATRRHSRERIVNELLSIYEEIAAVHTHAD